MKFRAALRSLSSLNALERFAISLDHNRTM